MLFLGGQSKRRLAEYRPGLLPIFSSLERAHSRVRGHNFPFQWDAVACCNLRHLPQRARASHSQSFLIGYTDELLQRVGPTKNNADASGI